ncbi:MAG: hypothetical protein NTV58_10365 [Deltaproteobacteria bacterium]|nr:hypothetical protein [Deltaproteobacteria bacterium]
MKFVLCIDDGGYPEALKVRKLYEVREDTEAERKGMIRVIDESGEDYLYARDFSSLRSFPQQSGIPWRQKRCDDSIMITGLSPCR